MIRRAAAVLLAGLGACTVDLAPPEPLSVDPPRGYNGEETAIAIEGRRFYPQIEVDSTGGGRSEVNAGFTVRIEQGTVDEAVLSGVSLEDYEHIRAVVPQGLELGTYDVIVIGPSGEEGRLEDGFVVTDTRADRIEVDSESVVYEVFDIATLDISLVDPQGEPVLADIDVVVVVSNDAGAVAAQFEPDGLEDQQPFGTGFGISGHLGDDGQARIGFTLGTPDTVDVVVSPGPNAAQLGEGTIKIRFDPGSILGVDMALPEDPLVVTAGETFPVVITLVDQFGNPVPDAEELIVLKDTCDSFVDAVAIEESATVEVTLGEATGTVGCPIDRLVTIAGPSGASDDITVLPGAVAAFDVQTSPSLVTAGEPDLDAVVTPVDAYGNRAAWTPSDLTLTDTVGGVGTATCGEGIPVFCTVQPIVAAPGVRLRVEDEAGIVGLSSVYTVRPGAPDSLEVLPGTGPAVAGAPLPVAVRVLDAFGNLVAGAVVPDSVVWTSAGDLPECAVGPTDPDGTLHFGCALFEARTDAVLSAEVALPALSGESVPFEVVNGPLTDVVVIPSDTSVVAGDPVDLSFTGFDAYGNPWIHQDDPVVDLADTGGSLSLTSVTLDALGTAEESGTFTRAGSTEVVALRSGQEVGRSAPIDVDAGPADAIALDTGVPWVWVGDDVPVAVAVVDEFGNTADFDGTVTLSAASGNAGPVPVTVVDGNGTGVLVWSAPNLSETILATATGGLGGASPAFAVVEDCTSGGPTADVSFGGFDDALVCLDAQGEGLLAASLTGSTAGGTGLALYGVRAGDVWTTSTSDPMLEVVLPGAGRYDVQALVARTDGCGDEALAEAWAGPDDGGAVGPIDVDPTSSTLVVGQESTPVALHATDCSRDDAGGAIVRLRADRGDIEGATSTGSGLGVVLDGTGSGTATLDATGTDSGGPGSIVAWAPDGAAFGSAAMTFVGDDRRPLVWEMDPAGDTAGLVDTVVLGFSEPLLAGSVVPAAFTVDGPFAVTVLTAVPSGSTVTLTLDPDADADAGGWTLTAADTLRDAAGNHLDGAGTGLQSDFVGRFGDLPSQASPVSACAPTPTTFRPDGDDGPGNESDDVVFGLDSNEAPFRWVATVHGAGETVPRRDRLVPAGTNDTWTWDGRDAGGKVLPDGAYVVTIDAEDADGNLGGACTAIATIQQHAGGAP